MNDPEQLRDKFKKALEERKQNLPFVETWVNPFYLQVLHGNYSALRGEEEAGFVRQVNDALAAITEEVAAQMLSSYGWREQLTGSWFCGLKDWKQFTSIIGASLVASKNCYQGQGFAFALACFGDTASAEYLAQYLDQYLPQTELWYDQGWALSALTWIDAHHGGSRARAYLEPGGLWDRFVADKGSGWEFETRRNEFWRQMTYCQRNFTQQQADV